MNHCRLVVVCLAGLVPGLAAAGPAPAPATVKEYDRVFTTYPFSDPDPIASVPRPSCAVG